MSYLCKLLQYVLPFVETTHLSTSDTTVQTLSALKQTILEAQHAMHRDRERFAITRKPRVTFTVFTPKARTNFHGIDNVKVDWLIVGSLNSDLDGFIN